LKVIKAVHGEAHLYPTTCEEEMGRIPQFGVSHLNQQAGNGGQKHLRFLELYGNITVTFHM
jgi:hypothetical protein